MGGIRDQNIALNANISPNKILGGCGMLGLLSAGPGGITKGQAYFVNKDGGSDGNDGLSADLPQATIESAVTDMNGRIDWTASPWGNHDILYIYPGTYAENLTSLPYGCFVIGLGTDIRDAQIGVKVKPSSGDALDCASWVNGHMEYVGWESVDTAAAFDAAILNNVYMYKCFFTGAAEATTAVYGLWTSDSTKLTLDTCWACNADNGFYFTYTDANDGINYLDMVNCKITGCSATGIYTHTNLVGPHSTVRFCHISGSGQTLAIGIDDNAGVLDESFNCIEATTAVDGVRSSNGSYGNGVLLT